MNTETFPNSQNDVSVLERSARLSRAKATLCGLLASANLYIAVDEIASDNTNLPKTIFFVANSIGPLVGMAVNIENSDIASEEATRLTADN